jgi:hypothetical protein
MLSEAAKLQHSIRTVNVTISAQNLCFGNRWQQLLIDNFVGYDTILMNSLLHSHGKGYLYNFQTKELYNLNYNLNFQPEMQPELPHGLEGLFPVVVILLFLPKVDIMSELNCCCKASVMGCLIVSLPQDVLENMK